jgi:hypothetical protein
MTDNPTAIRSHSWRPLCNLLRWHKEILKQGYVAPVLKSSLHKLYGRHHNLVDHYEISISQITFYVDVYFLYHCQYFYQTWLYIRVTRRVSYKKHELLTLREHLSWLPVFLWGPCCSSFLFSVSCFCFVCLCSVSNVVCVLCPMLPVSLQFAPGFLFVMYVLYISPSMRLYVLSSVFWCPLRFRHENNIPFVLPPLVCRRVHVSFMIFVFVAYRGVPHSVISYVRTFSVPCCDVRIKRCSVRLCPQFFLYEGSWHI